MRIFPPVADGDAQRVSQMRFRRRLFTSTHRDDVREAARARFGLERAGAMDAAIDWPSNPYPTLWEQMCALYVHEPRVRGPSERAAAAVRASRHWVRMQRGQRDTLGLRELLILLDLNQETGALVTRPVYPDLFTPPVPLASDPSQLGEIGVWLEVGDEDWELRQYDLNAVSYVRSTLSATDGRLVEAERFEGADYPWVAGGVSFIPGVLYHAAETGYLLDWETGTDVAHASVGLCVDYTSAQHAHADASWPQRGMIDGDVEGAETHNVAPGSSAPARSVVVADPSVVLKVTSTMDKQAREFQWTASADPEALLRYCRVRYQGIAAAAGIRTPEVTRAASDIRSGYSLAVSREAMAELQLKFKQVFGAADRELLHKAALMLGEPSEGPEAWTVRYRPLRWAGAEQAQIVTQVAQARAAGLMTRLEAVLTLHPDLTEDEAREMIDEIDAEGPPPALPGAVPPAGAQAGG